MFTTFLAIVEFHDSNVASEMDNFSQPFQENARIILQSGSRAFPFTSFFKASFRNYLNISPYLQLNVVSLKRLIKYRLKV